MNLPVLTVVVIIYCAVVAWLGWLGYRNTRSAADYLVGGRQIHPVLMALAYGSTFISTSAIVGFGGVAALYGMGLLWLTAANIFVGIFIAFVVFGRPTRRLGAALDAHTFPELLGRRFQLPLHPGVRRRHGGAAHAALRRGGADRRRPLPGGPAQARLLAGAARLRRHHPGLRVLRRAEGRGLHRRLPGGGDVRRHGLPAGRGLRQDRRRRRPPGAHRRWPTRSRPALQKGGHQGWTAMPVFGSPIWWQLVSTIVLGVGIGVLAQPQLTLRFMTVKSGRELHRALVPGGVFILFMTGVAFVTGALTNVYFWNGAGQDRPGHGDRPGHRQAERGQGHPHLHPVGHAAVVRLPVHADAAGGGHVHALGPVPRHRHRHRARRLPAGDRPAAGTRSGPSPSPRPASWSASWPR